MNDKTDHASLLWDRAEECRVIAAYAADPKVKAEYVRLAEDYLALAAREEALAERSK